MNRYFLYLFTLLLSLNLFSCTLLEIMDDVHTFSSRDEEKDIPGHVHIDVENGTNELILVNLVYFDTNGEKTGRTMELARISIGEIKMVNIRKGSTISVIGGNTRKEYLESICENDYERFIIKR